jgi:ADP-ribose pyrophosphatase
MWAGTPVAGIKAMQLSFGAQDVRLREDSQAHSGYFSVRRLVLSHRLFAGGWSDPLTRELFERGDAVGVLPWDPERDELIMLEQFRVGAMRGEDSPWMLELVAGVVEEGESDEEVARREAVEEAALEIQQLHPVACYYPSAGACSERVRLFIGKVSSPSEAGIHGCRDEGEDIKVHVMPRQQVVELLESGQIANGHTLIALQWLQLHAADLRERWR